MEPSILVLELIPLGENIHYTHKLLTIQQLTTEHWYLKHLLPLKKWNDVDQYLKAYFKVD